MRETGESAAPRSTRRTRAGRVVPAALVDVCRGRAPHLPSDAKARALFLQSVRYHRIAPLAYVSLRSTGQSLAASLKEDRDTAVANHIAASVVLDGVSELLDGRPWAVFKGPVLSENAHPAPGLRTYHDIDLLVSPRDIREVSARFGAAGWHIIDFRDMLRNPETPGEMHWVSPTGMLIDLHWSMINMASTRRLFSVPTEDILDRRTHVQIGLAGAWTLDATDSLVHVCLHAALTGAHRMLLLLDADQLARQVIDWDGVISRARSWSAAPAVAIVLARARALLGTPLPRDLNQRLGVAPGLRLITGSVDRLQPVSTLRQEASLARLIARSARPHSYGTLAAIGRRGLRGLTDRLRGTTATAEQRDRKSVV